MISKLPTVTGRPDGLRALTMYADLPEQHGIFPVVDNDHAPHLRLGEIAIFDKTDREPQHGELFVVQWSGGGRAIRQVVRREHRGIDGGMFEGWWTRSLAPNVFIPGYPPMTYADGPQLIEHFREKLIGRVVGIFDAKAATEIGREAAR